MIPKEDLRRMHEAMRHFPPYYDLGCRQLLKLFRSLQGLDAIVDTPLPSAAVREISRVKKSLSRLSKFNQTDEHNKKKKQMDLNPRDLAHAAIAEAYGRLVGVGQDEAMLKTLEFFNAADTFSKCAGLAGEALTSRKPFTIVTAAEMRTGRLEEIFREVFPEFPCSTSMGAEDACPSQLLQFIAAAHYVLPSAADREPLDEKTAKQHLLAYRRKTRAG